MTKNKECGFTLIELMIAMAILTMVMASVYGVYIASSRTATIQNASAAAQQSVRLGIELMAQDIRMAGFDPLGTAGAAIVISQPGKIQVTSDKNSDGSINDTGFERISYELSRTDLRRILYEGTARQSVQPLIENVTDLVFTYSGSNNCNVTIELEITELAGLADPIVRRLETQVYCRNLDL